jgi:hypothetical protein
MERSLPKVAACQCPIVRTDAPGCVILRTLRLVWKKWVAFGHLCARVNSVVLMTLI